MLSSLAAVFPTREPLLSRTHPSRAPPDSSTRPPAPADSCYCSSRSPASAAVCCCSSRPPAEAVSCCCCSCCCGSYWFCIVRFSSIFNTSAILLSEWLTPPSSSCPPTGGSDFAEPSCDILVGTTGIHQCNRRPRNRCCL